MNCASDNKWNLLQVKGLCGNLDGNSQNDMKSSSGLPSDIVPFGDSWRDGSCIDLAIESQPFQPCKTQSAFNDAAVQMCQWVGHQDIFSACTGMINWVHYRTACEYDMCARKDPSDNCPMCLFVSAMAMDCLAHGIKISWYDNFELAHTCASK